MSGKPYNLDHLLHRGQYSIDSVKKIHPVWTWRSVWGKLIGITPEYTLGDKVIAWVIFGYSFVFRVVILFAGMALWNAVSPWPAEWWRSYFFLTTVCLGVFIGVISTVWFMIGGVIDTHRLF